MDQGADFHHIVEGVVGQVQNTVGRVIAQVDRPGEAGRHSLVHVEGESPVASRVGDLSGQGEVRVTSQGEGVGQSDVLGNGRRRSSREAGEGAAGGDVQHGGSAAESIAVCSSHDPAGQLDGSPHIRSAVVRRECQKPAISLANPSRAGESDFGGDFQLPGPDGVGDVPGTV